MKVKIVYPYQIGFSLNNVDPKLGDKVLEVFCSGIHFIIIYEIILYII